MIQRWFGETSGNMLFVSWGYEDSPKETEWRKEASYVNAERHLEKNENTTPAAQIVS